MILNLVRNLVAPVLQPPASHLRLHTEEPAADSANTQAENSLNALCRAFEDCTGWPLRFTATRTADPSHPTWAHEVRSDAFGTARLWIEKPRCIDSRTRVPSQVAQEFVAALSGVINELTDACRTVRERESELAASVANPTRPIDRPHLAQRLEQILRDGAAALGFDSAALYMLDSLDSDTPVLKLRASWGLPVDRTSAPARTLDSSTADVEALLGHSVVVDDPYSWEVWSPPEPCGAGACVGVSAGSTPLGTCWMFSHRKRKLTTRQTRMIDLVGGHIAAELVRDALEIEALDAGRLKRQFTQAARWQECQTSPAPCLNDGWTIAGYVCRGDGLSVDFLDWLALSANRLALAVGRGQAPGLCGALVAANVRAAFRAHATQQSEAEQLLERINEVAWGCSPGDQAATLFCGLLDANLGTLKYASAGDPVAIRSRDGRIEALSDPGIELAVQPRLITDQRELVMLPGDVVLLATEGLREVLDQTGNSSPDSDILADLLADEDASAAQVIGAIRARLERIADEHDVTPCCSFVVIKRDVVKSSGESRHGDD